MRDCCARFSWIQSLLGPCVCALSNVFAGAFLFMCVFVSDNKVMRDEHTQSRTLSNELRIHVHILIKNHTRNSCGMQVVEQAIPIKLDPVTTWINSAFCVAQFSIVVCAQCDKPARHKHTYHSICSHMHAQSEYTNIIHHKCVCISSANHDDSIGDARRKSQTMSNFDRFISDEMTETTNLSTEYILLYFIKICSSTSYN